jgi:hypothetical protein
MRGGIKNSEKGAARLVAADQHGFSLRFGPRRLGRLLLSEAQAVGFQAAGTALCDKSVANIRIRRLLELTNLSKLTNLTNLTKLMKLTKLLSPH